MSSLSIAVTLALICFESCFGTWLLVCARSAWNWRAAIACFAAFACVSAYKYLSGEAACGCFGLLQVNPAITLVLDLAVVRLLMLCRSGVETTSESRLHRMIPRFASFAIALSLLVISLVLYGQSCFVTNDGSVTAAGDLVVLNPASWIGKRWPFLDESGVPTELATGQWDVLLFQHDCDVCHDVMLELEQILSTYDGKHRIAFIGIDERRDDVRLERMRELDCRLGYLPQDREWFTTTPLRLRLNDGSCVSASVIEHWQ
jgi:hypothetical protein